MSFSTEVSKLQRTLRVFLRLQTGTGSENPGVSGTFTDRRWGKVPDNAGTVPVKGTVSRFGVYTRALANADQGFETPSVTTELIDKNNEWRVLGARPWQILNRILYYTLRVRQDDGTYIDSDVAWGQLTNPQYPAGKVNFQIQNTPDFLGNTTPRRLVSVDDFPNADPSALGKAVPYIYGVVDNTASSVQNFTGTIDPLLAAPTGLTATVNVGAGNSAPGHYYYAIVAEVSGAKSEISNIVQVDLGVGDQVVLNWPAYSGATAIRVFQGPGFGLDFGQMVQYRVSGLTYSDSPLAGGAITLTDNYAGYSTRDPTPGGADPHWDLNYRQTIYYYVTAVVGGVEAPMTGPVSFALQPQNLPRTVHLSWSAVPGATAYKLRRLQQEYHFDPGWNREWTILPPTTSQVDPNNDVTAVNIPEAATKPVTGAVECLYVDTNPVGTAGQFRYLIAGHGCKKIKRVYVTKSTSTAASDGSVSTTPPTPTLQTENVDYFCEALTINGNRYQTIRFNASQAGNLVTADVYGIESLGTATGVNDGGTLITNIIDQFKHFLYNWVFNSYASGAWFTTTAFQPNIINDASFAAASTLAAARIPGGYIGAGIQKDVADVRTVIQDWAASCDVDWYFWNAQFKVKMFDITIVDPHVLPQYTDVESIFKDTFQPVIDTSRHWNKINWQAGPQVTGWLLSGYEKDDISIANYGRTINSPVKEYRWTRDLGTVNDIVTRALRLYKNPPVYATWSTPLKALNDELAALIAATHAQGIEVASTGWIRRVCKIIRSDIDLDRLLVNIQVLDVDTLIAVLGYVRYGDRTWSTADKSYVTAIPSGKTSVYGYLADRNTGRFSNGDPAKKFGSR